MPDWFPIGLVVLFAMAILVAEMLLARLIPRRQRAGFIANAAAGLALLGALYAALNEAGALAVLACLAGGLTAHLAYLVIVWRDRA